jgi:hypothetical protein
MKMWASVGDDRPVFFVLGSIPFVPPAAGVHLAARIYIGTFYEQNNNPLFRRNRHVLDRQSRGISLRHEHRMQKNHEKAF